MEMATKKPNSVTITHSQRREMKSRQPSRSSCSTPVPAAGGIAGSRIPRRNAPASKKLTASIAIPQPGPGCADQDPAERGAADLRAVAADPLHGVGLGAVRHGHGLRHQTERSGAEKRHPAPAQRRQHGQYPRPTPAGSAPAPPTLAWASACRPLAAAMTSWRAAAGRPPPRPAQEHHYRHQVCRGHVADITRRAADPEHSANGSATVATAVPAEEITPHASTSESDRLASGPRPTLVSRTPLSPSPPSHHP